jgi:hypothetical protein
MMRRCSQGLMCVTAVAMIGCLPEKRIAWSPDGSRALVIAADGLRLCDAQGRLTEPLLPSQRAVWMPEGKRILSIHGSMATRWSIVEPVLNAEQLDQIARAAGELHKQLLAHDGPWDKFDPKIDPPLTGGELAAALLYVRDNLHEGLPEHLGEKWKDLEKMELNLWSVQVFDVEEKEVLPGALLHLGLDEPHGLRVAPNGRLAGFLLPLPGGKNPRYQLFAAPTDGAQPPRWVANDVAMEYDFSPDGTQIAYIHTPTPPEDGSDTIVLGGLATVRVADADGRLLDEWTEQQDHVGLLFSPVLAVRWLHDGRLVFTSHETSLPATTRDMPQRWGLFVLDPRMGSTVIRLLGRDFEHPLANDFCFFEFSPDESRVLLPGPWGQVTCYTSSNGHAETVIADTSSKDRWRSLPVWRNNEEICFVAPRGSSMASPERAEIVLWKSDKQHRVISRDWPAEAVAEWLTQQEKSGEPADAGK